jgi:hypothetical protein
MFYWDIAAIYSRLAESGLVYRLQRLQRAAGSSVILYFIITLAY